MAPDSNPNLHGVYVHSSAPSGTDNTVWHELRGPSVRALLTTALDLLDEASDSDDYSSTDLAEAHVHVLQFSHHYDSGEPEDADRPLRLLLIVAEPAGATLERVVTAEKVNA